MTRKGVMSTVGKFYKRRARAQGLTLTIIILIIAIRKLSSPRRLYDLGVMHAFRTSRRDP